MEAVKNLNNVLARPLARPEVGASTDEDSVLIYEDVITYPRAGIRRHTVHGPSAGGADQDHPCRILC